jgi:MFS family permease
MGLVYITAAAILPQWFSSRRSLAVGIASSGAGLGGLFYSLLTGHLVQKIGIEWTYRVLACITLVMNVASAILLKDRNKMVKPIQNSFNYRELGHVEVLLIIAWGIVTDIGYVVLLFSLPHYAESVGLSQTQGSIVGAMLSLGLAIGRPFIGYYSDTFGRINMAGSMTALCGLLCLAIWVPAKSFAVLIVFAIPAGAVTGIFWGTYKVE